MPFRRFLNAYYAYIFLSHFILGYAIYTAYFQISGLSVWEISLLFACWSLSVAIFEIPSGALSDHLDRRWLLIAAPLVRIVTFVLWIYADGSFAVFVLGFVIWSFSDSLVSGSKEALLYEHMQANRIARHYDKVLGMDRAVVEISVGIALIVGGFVGHVSMAAALWLAVPPLLLAAIAACWLPDIRRKAGGESGSHGYFGHFVEALREFRSHADLRFLTGYLVLGVMLYGVLGEFDPLYYLAVGMPIWSFGLIAAGALAAFAGANIYAHRFAGFRAGSWLFPLASGASLLVAGLAQSAWMLIPLTLAYVLIAPVWVLAEAKFQRVMDGNSRATTTSARAFFHGVASIAMSLIVGFAASKIGIVATYGWCGAYLIGFSAWAWHQDKRGRSAI